MTSTFDYEDLEVLRNRTFDEIVVGDRASIQRTLTAADIQLFAAMSGDTARPATSTPSPRARAAWRHRARHVGRRADLGGARHAAARPGHELRGPDAEVPCARARGRHAHHHRNGDLSRGGDAPPGARLPVHEPGRRDGDLRRGDGDRARRAHRAPARHAAAGAGVATARRRARAGPAVREAPWPHQGGGRLSVRRVEPVGRARRPRRRDHRAGADRPARAPGGRGAEARRKASGISP